MSDPVILVEKHGETALVTLNRPQAMNALSRELRAAIAETFDALEADPGVRVAILTGAGKAFCAGLDLKELGQGADTVQGSVTTRDPVTSMNRFSGPIIGAINGVAVTGGFEDRARLRRADLLDRGALCRHARPRRNLARLGPVAKTLAHDRHLPREGAVAHRQFPDGEPSRRLGPRQPRRRPRTNSSPPPKTRRRHALARPRGA